MMQWVSWEDNRRGNQEHAGWPRSACYAASSKNFEETALAGAFLLRGFALLLALLFLPGVFLLGGILGEGNGNGRESEGHAEHQTHQFFHLYSSPWRFDELTRRLWAMISNLT